MTYNEWGDIEMPTEFALFDIDRDISDNKNNTPQQSIPKEMKNNDIPHKIEKEISI